MLPTLPHWRACQLALYREEWRLAHTHIELHTHKQNHRSMLAKTDCVCVGRCLNCTGRGGPSNALTKHHQMSRQTGWLNFSYTVKANTTETTWYDLWLTGAGLWWRSSWASTWRTKIWTSSTSWRRSCCPLLVSCWTGAELSRSTALWSVGSVTV